MALTFNGGIRLPELKATRRFVIEIMPQPKAVSIPLLQYSSTKLTPCVKIGDKVDKGQVIGVPGAELGCYVHASISGTVTNIENSTDANGNPIQSIVIENDGENRLHPDIKPWEKRLMDTTTEEIIDIVRKAGITGLGGASFPTHAKIRAALGKVTHLIINCAESEPYLTANHRLLLENPDAVINGIKILLKAFALREGEIAIEDNKINAINKLEERLEGSKMIKVRVLKTKYPQGDEKQLIYSLTGKEFPSDKLPIDIGCCVFNPETCAAIFSAFVNGMPLTERIVTVDGDCIKKPKNLLVPIGTSCLDVINYCGGLTKKPKKVIFGGGMLGKPQIDLNAPILKGTSGVIVLSSEPGYDQPPACIRCGRCVAICPMKLMPNYLAIFSNQENYDMAKKFDLMSCSECGSCSYICPAHVPILNLIKTAKAQLSDAEIAWNGTTEQTAEERRDANGAE